MTPINGEAARYAAAWDCNLPTAWRYVPLRYFATLKTGHTPSRSVADYWLDCSIPWVTLADVAGMRRGDRKNISETNELISPRGLQNSAAELLPAGTVILSRTASVGFAAVLASPMATSQDFVNWICSSALDASYLFWVFQSMRSEFSRLTNGSVHKTIYMPDAAAFRIPLPPSISEQRAIAAFLDREISEADTLVAKYERLIELLEEKRAALIIHAITKGLDSTVPMKNSGIGWMAAIPQGWDLTPLSYVGQIRSGNAVPQSATLEPSDKTVFPIHGSTGTIGYCHCTNFSGAAILIARVGAHAGLSRYVETEGWVTDNTLILTLSERLRYDYAKYLFRAMPINDHASKTAQPLITSRVILSQRVPVPSILEQKSIAIHLATEDNRLDNLAMRARAAIALINERRAALITTAITGQIDVQTYRREAPAVEIPA